VLWTLAILVPGVTLAVVIVLLDRSTTISSPTSLLDNTTKSPLLRNPLTLECGAEPIECNENIPNSCERLCGDEWTCTHITPSESNYGVEGSFCLPRKPADDDVSNAACTHVPLDPNQQMAGVWRWRGWEGVNVKNWTCSCPYPRFYSMDTQDGRCKKSSQLCRGGTWTYPCVRNATGDGCMTLTPEEQEEYQGADVLNYGMCECPTGQHVQLNGATGLPECVEDTCSVLPSCSADTPCPGNATCGNDGKCVLSTSSCTSHEDCGKGGQCDSVTGTCTWGYWKPYASALYVFGSCECPETCKSLGAYCVCDA